MNLCLYHQGILLTVLTRSQFSVQETIGLFCWLFFCCGYKLHAMKRFTEVGIPYIVKVLYYI